MTRPAILARGALVGAGLAAGLAVATRRQRRRRHAMTLPTTTSIDSTSRRARTTDLARLGSRVGAGYATHQARRVFASAARREELDAEFEMKTAEQVTAALGNMKGALMKIGQMASYLDDGLPEPLREALAQLQQEAPPMSPELAAGVIEEELGATPSDLFEEWDDKPVAAASIGQVHRAITRDGRAVAVKVQYPGVGDAVRADLDNTDTLFAFMAMAFPKLDTKAAVTELRARIGEELDYVNEAANQQLFVDFYRGHPFIHVPDVVPELSRARVLTTELAVGARFDELAGWTQEERNRASEAIYRFVFGSLYRLRAFNGDPHPGNYLFRPGGHVTFLDFGLVKRFAPEETKLLERLIQTIVLDRDLVAFRSVIEEAGFLAPNAPISIEEVEAYFGHFYDFVLEDKVTTFTHEYAAETVRRVFLATGDQRDVVKWANVPPAFVILQRINVGLYSILAHLGATANFRRIAEEIWPMVGRGPTTPMGEAEAAWWADRHAGELRPR